MAKMAPAVNVARSILHLLVLLCPVLGFPKGAPSYSCRNLIPGHSNGTQSSPPPYRLEVTDRIIPAGGSTTITLESTGDFPFKGFLCAVSYLDDVDNNSVGRMSVSPSTSSWPSTSELIAPVTCSRSTPDTGMTHSSNSDKYRVQFDWSPPPSATVGEQFKLRCTCVMNFFRCWTGFRIDLAIGASPSTSVVTTGATNDMRGSNSIMGDNNSNNNNNGINRVSDLGSQGFAPLGLTNNFLVNSPSSSSFLGLFGDPVNNGSPGVPINSLFQSPSGNLNGNLVDPNNFSDISISIPIDPSSVQNFMGSENNMVSGPSAPNLVDADLLRSLGLDIGSLIQSLNQIGGSINPNLLNIPQTSQIPSQAGNHVSSFTNNNQFNPTSTNPNTSLNPNRGQNVGRRTPNQRGQNRRNRPSILNLPNRFLERGNEFFAGLEDAFSFPTSFFITPRALQRFRERNLL